MTLDATGTSPSLDRALEYVGTHHRALIDDIAASRRVLWLGSGISLSEVPGLKDLIRKILLFLRRTREAAAKETHEQVLKRIIENYFPMWLDDYEADPSNWQVPLVKDFPRSIERSYSDILAEPVGNEPPDYLLWEAVDVRETYGAPSISPGINHDLVAALMLEGLLPNVVSANWDGLVELAYRRMSGSGHDQLRVLMTPEDFRTSSGTTGPRLYKLHGCAVRARENAGFRSHLVASKIGIAAWGLTDDPYSRLKSDVTNLMTDCPTLVIGLSFQDFDLVQANLISSASLGWGWKPEDPAYIVADASVQPGHRNLFEGAYGGAYTTNREAVENASLVPMYAEPVLAAIVVRVLSLKVTTLLSHVAQLKVGSELHSALVLALTRREVELSSKVERDYGRVVAFLMGFMSPLVNRFHGLDAQSGYASIHHGPLQNLREGSDAKRSGAPHLAALLALVNHVAYTSEILCSFESDSGEPGVIEMARLGEQSQYLVPVKDDEAAAAVRRSTLWNESKKRIVLVRPTGEADQRRRRSPASALGQGRRPGDLRHEVSVEQVWKHGNDSSKVAKGFLQVVAL